MLTLAIPPFSFAETASSRDVPPRAGSKQSNFLSWAHES